MKIFLENLFNVFLSYANFDPEIDFYLEETEREAYCAALADCDYSDCNIFTLEVSDCYSTINFNCNNKLSELINMVLNHNNQNCNRDIVHTLVTIFYGRKLSNIEEFQFHVSYMLYSTAHNYDSELFDFLYGKLKSEIEDKHEAVQAVAFVLAVMKSDKPNSMIVKMCDAHTDKMDEF